MIEFIYIICIVLLAVASWTDLKTYEVPDWINYSGIFAGLGIRLIWSLYSFDWSFILEGIAGFGAFLGVGVVLFYLGQWGGGDSKLLMALGALLGLKLSFSHVTVLFLANLVIVGGVYGFLWSAGLALMNYNKFKVRFKKKLDSCKKLRLVIVLFSALLLVFAFFKQEGFLRLLFMFVAVLVPFMNYVIIGVKSVEDVCMYSRVKPKDLTEGDWIAKDVFVKKKKICGPKDLGIEKKQIRQLIKLNVKSVVVRTGIPFVPSFFIAFLITLWIGSPLMFFI